MFAAHSYCGSLSVCFMWYGAISYIFWLCYVIRVIRDVGPKNANIALKQYRRISRLIDPGGDSGEISGSPANG